MRAYRNGGYCSTFMEIDRARVRFLVHYGCLYVMDWNWIVRFSGML